MYLLARVNLPLIFAAAAVSLCLHQISVGHRMSFNQMKLQQPDLSESAQGTTTIMRMAANEEQARKEREHFSYISQERSTRTGGHLWKEKAVEVDDGVLRRLLAVDGHPLTPAETLTEERRIEDLTAHPEAFRKLNAAHEEDERRAIQLLQMLPKAFLISSDGQQQGCARFAFQPNPTFQPSTYQERVMDVMEGTVSIKEPENRLCDLEATISQSVVFGFGLLGRLNSGGHFSFQRALVDRTSWKTVHISVHLDGRVLLLKSLSRDQEVTRTNIVPVPQHLSLKEAAKLTHP